MNNYYPTNPNDQPVTAGKALLLSLLVAIWVFTGLVGHDPWKQDEAISFGPVYSMLQSGDWLVPMLAGEPYLDKPPLFYVAAAAFARLFSPWLPLHDGARLVSGLLVSLTLLFVGLGARELFGRGRGWPAVLILIGCLGMLVRAHQMITDLGLLLGCAMMLYAYGLIRRRPLLAGCLLGVGLGLGFMTKGFIAPIWFVLVSGGLLLFPNWRMRETYLALGVAVVVALPWLLVWPILLYQRSPTLFLEWLWVRNIGHWFAFARGGDYSEALYYIKSLPWLAWPALPLAGWVVWQERTRVMRDAELQLPLLMFLVMLVTLSLIPDIQEVFALPMLLPLSLLATASLATLRRGAANALDWFGIMTFGLLAILLWWGWAGLLLDNEAHITKLFKQALPEFVPAFRPWAFWSAVVFSILWVTLVWRVGRSFRRAVVNWASGVTLVWVLAMTLWLPWIDMGKSYRSMVYSLKEALPVEHGCIAGQNLGNAQRAMLDYFGGIVTVAPTQNACEWLLVQGGSLAQQTDISGRWKQTWEGGRPGDIDERYRLYRRMKGAPGIH